MASNGDKALIVGLTGGIASGKSVVAGMFADLGVPIVDTDEVAREVVEPGQPALAEVATAFGPEGMVLIHLLAEVAPETPIFNLDTGYQFPETLEMREKVARRYGIDVAMHRPELSVDQYEAQHGGPVHAPAHGRRYQFRPARPGQGAQGCG